MGEPALAGLRILDLTQFEAGPSCTEFLGWLGADVIKIESLAGDPGRRNRAPGPGRDGMFFLLFNANKRSVALDLKAPEGRSLFLRMVKRGDVVVENFAPGVMERLDLDYPVLREANPRLIMARIKGFGLTGEYSDYKSFEFIAQAMGGVMSLNGFPDREPVRLGAGVGDSGSGIHAAAAILAAILQRQRTGEGQLVEVSMQEVVTNFLRVRFTDHYLGESFAPRIGNEIPGSVPAGVYPCAPHGSNDYVFIVVHSALDRLWDDFARAIGREELLSDPRCKDAATRWRHRDEIHAITREWTSARTKREAMRILGGAGVPCGAVLDTADVLDDPHLNERGAIVTVDHPVHGPYRMPGCPVRLSASPAVTTPAPLLGQHTGEVLAEVLGLGEAETSELRARGIVG